MRILAVAAVVLGLAAAAAAANPAYEPIYVMVSPGGQEIAWFEGQSWQLWESSVDGIGAHTVGAAFAANGVSLAAWTPRGIVVDSNFAVWLITQSGRHIRLGPDDDFTFSVGGDRVASGSGGQQGQIGPVRVVDLRTRRTVTMGLPRAANYEPVLSPDGRRVAWVASGSVYVARVGGRPRRLVKGGGCLSWSPDGKWIAYVAGPHTLRIVAPSGGAPRTLSLSAGGCNIPGLPRWSPDSTRIATSSNELTVTDVRTHASVSVAKALGRVAGGFTWSKDGTALFASVRPWVRENAHDDCTNLMRLDAASLRGDVVVRGCP